MMQTSRGHLIREPEVSRWMEVIGRACLAGMAAVAYARLFFGVDYTDEAFYSALPDWFARGGRPFVDELNATQTAGLVLIPFYWLFHRLTGGESTGLILFNRHLYFLGLLFCAWLAAKAGRKHASVHGGRMLAAFVLGFSCFNIPALSYNTLASMGLLCGALLLVPVGVGNGVSPMATAGANIAFAFAALVYPSLFPASLAGCVAGWVLARDSESAARRAWWISIGLAALLAVGLLAWVGIANVRNSLSYSATYGYDWNSAWARMLRMGVRVIKGLGPGLLVGAVFLSGWRLAAGSSVRVAKILLVAALAALAAGPLAMSRWSAWARFPYDSVPVWMGLGLALPMVAWIGRDGWTSRCFWAVLPPCGLAAGLAGLSSSTGLWMAAIGLFPLAVISGLLLARQSCGPTTPVARAGLRAGAFTVGGMLMCVYLAVAMLGSSYRDFVFRDGQRVEWASGPYAGIATTAASAEFSRSLDADCAKLSGADRSVFVYDRFPAGYLFSRAAPRTFSVWIFWSKDEEANLRRLRPLFEPAELAPDVVLRGPETQPWIDSELERLGYAPYLTRDDLGYRFLVRGSAISATSR